MACRGEDRVAERHDGLASCLQYRNLLFDSPGWVA
jgi:hypothetical protein